MTQSVDCASTAARELYDDVWTDVGNLFFETEKLVDWQSWRHRFDEEIVDIDSANRCIDLMLESLDDEYTRRLSRAEVIEEKECAEQPQVEARILEGGIGLLRIIGFDAEDIADQIELGLLKLLSCRALVIDLRGNGGGLLNESVNSAELLVEKGPICTLKFRDGAGTRAVETYFGEDCFIGVQVFADGTDKTGYFRRRKCLRLNRPIVLLIDGGTASAAELVAAAMLYSAREDGSIVSVGKRSHGKGIGQQYILYEETGVKIKVTYARFYGPDDTWFGDCGQTVANGIRPDEEVDGADNQMQAAVRRARSLADLRESTKA
jgi:C-terminal processing protease CtpA/Prc